MKRFLFASLALAALSVAGVLCWWIWHVGHQTQTTVASYQHVASGAVTAEKAATEALQNSAKALESAREVLTAAKATIASYEGRSQAWEAIAQRESAALRGQLVYAQIMHVGPAVADARKLLQDSDALVVKATPQTIGLIAGWKQTGGFSAQTLRMVQPDIKTVTTEAAKAAPDARAVVSNVKAITKPPGILMKVVGFVGKLLF